MAITHPFVSAKADGGDATLVRPSNWNADHTIADIDASVTDARTNTVNRPITGTAQTSGTPAASIGVGLLLRAESADEAPSNFGALDCVASDVGAGTEDTYWEMLIRVAGAALAAAYRWGATTASLAIFTHANTANRTYTLANASTVLGAGSSAVVTDLTTGNVTTASATMTSITGLSAAITLPTGTSGKVLVTATISCANDDATGGGEFDIQYGAGPTYLFGDGTVGPGFLNQGTAAAGTIVTLSRVVTGLAAGAYTFQALFRRLTAGTLTANATALRHSTISAVEL